MAAAALPYTVTHPHRNVVSVAMQSDGNRLDWEQWFLLTSDHHWDNPKCERGLLKKHHDEALERRAGIIAAGDVLCAMQGKYDKRADKSSLRPEHQVTNYLDALVTTAADWYGPYAKNYIVIARGNHEQAIKKNHETDLIERLVAILNANNDANIQAGGYGGWVKFKFTNGTQRSSINLKYFHGSGGGGPVTKGVIGTNRRAVFLPDAHIVATGHVHESWQVEMRRERLNDAGRIYLDDQTHVCLATYKEEYGDGYEGYHVESGRPPKPTGAWWLRFYWDTKTKRVQYELRQAK